jgi:hypothetical protein
VFVIYLFYLQLHVGNTYIHIHINNNRRKNGEFKRLNREERRKHKTETIDDPLFHTYMLHMIRHHWIPLIENLDVGKGRNAYWNRERSVIMYRD